MDSEIIILSDDDDDDDVQPTTVFASRRMPSSPPRAKMPDPKCKTAADGSASDRPCPKSKKKHRSNNGGHGDGACARPTASASRPAATVGPARLYRENFTAAKPAPAVAAAKYPPPYPLAPWHAAQQASWGDVPPPPTMKLVGAGADGSIEIAWRMASPVATQRWARVKAFELYVCRETDAPPDTSMWRLVDEIAGQPLPEGCVLVSCPPGVHHIVLRAVDVHDRRTTFNGLTVTI